MERSPPYLEDDLQIIDFPKHTDYGPRNPPEINYNQLFVYADFIKPGKHQYIVTYENQITEPKPKPKVEEKK